MARTKYWLWYSSVPSLTAGRKSRILEAFGGDPERIFFAGREELLACPEIKEKDLDKLLDKSLERVNHILSVCESRGIRILTRQDADYPERLRHIPDPPAVLYVWGRLPAVDDVAAVAIVGTRKATPYGLKMAGKLGREIAEAGGVVVSGLAEGIDSMAMESAIRAGGRCIGVLGTAIDEVYPKFNKPLFDQVRTGGALLSEYPPGMRTYPSDFKQRNRLIAGLSLGVVVVEAPVRSGSLDTAGHALEQNRDVYAVPGNADAPAFGGCLRLIREGAEPVSCGGDVMEHYASFFAPVPPKTTATQLKKEIDKPKDLLYIDLREKIQKLPERQRTVAEAMTEPEMLADDIVVRTGLSAPEVSSALTMLQIAGLVRQGSGKRFTLDWRKDTKY